MSVPGETEPPKEGGGSCVEALRIKDAWVKQGVRW